MSHAHPHPHGHGHGLVDASIKRSRAGLTAVGWSLLVLGLTAVAQTVVFVASGSVALLADLIHNFGDAATAFPLAIAFALRSERAERWAGLFVVAAIFVSACVAGIESVHRLIDPREPDHLLALAAAGV
ncbi:MAG TPA: cation transporter, partial [Acidimicrobiia bacterium]